MNQWWQAIQFSKYLYQDRKNMNEKWKKIIFNYEVKSLKYFFKRLLVCYHRNEDSQRKWARWSRIWCWRHGRSGSAPRSRCCPRQPSSTTSSTCGIFPGSGRYVTLNCHLSYNLESLWPWPVTLLRIWQVCGLDLWLVLEFGRYVALTRLRIWQVCDLDL